ncbi:hypothetical protein QTI66_27235 [Variovorax sp. J22R133]|uniref:hypothetical protein n=1 Tax=Variovorax brevis TaxID=3053503 RepID=UPI0025785A12|nr:hypothetical protein [Variovorax sp. J22R133]MDM0115872.1 hypothetical protein [Variovorax sp. J22R133]
MKKDVKEQIKACKDMIKGRTAEVLVEELFRLLGYSVHRYGMENSLPSILHELGQFRNNRIIDKVRSLPDFIITKGGAAYEIEVKYREDSIFKFRDLSEKYPEYAHVEVLFVVVSPETIKCISFSDLKGGSSTSAGAGHLLGDRPEFAEHYDIINYYSGFSRKVFNEGLRNFSTHSSH